jgi:hypothetical protein
MATVYHQPSARGRVGTTSAELSRGRSTLGVPPRRNTPTLLPGIRLSGVMNCWRRNCVWNPRKVTLAWGIRMMTFRRALGAGVSDDANHAIGQEALSSPPPQSPQQGLLISNSRQLRTMDRHGSLAVAWATFFGVRRSCLIPWRLSITRRAIQPRGATA